MERPQSRNDHPGDGDLEVRAGLVENEEIEPKTIRQLDARPYLLAPIEVREFREARPPDGSLAVRLQIGMPAQRQGIDVVLAGATAFCPIGREPRIEFAHRPERCQSWIEIRACREFDVFPTVFRPMQYGNDD